MMQGWSAAPSSRPQSYSVACVEGHRLQGQRTEGYQALRCPTCGEGIFVLPRSPLPEPPIPARSNRTQVAQSIMADLEDEPLVLSDPPIGSSNQKMAEVEIPEAEIEWVDDPPPDLSTRPEVKPPNPVAKARPRTTRPQASAPAGPLPTIAPAAQPAIAVEPSPTVLDWASSHRNALLVVAVLILVTGAIGLRLRRQRLEQLPQIAETGRIEGLKNLDAGEFYTAKKLLTEAVEAVRGLGGRVEGAEEIRQGALEAAIFADLAPAGLEEILEDAESSDPERWPAKFASLYQGRSVILDAPVTEVANPAQPGSSYKIYCPIYFGRGPTPAGRGRIDLKNFRLFELSQPKVDEQKPFGARYASVIFDVESRQWVVTFEPESGVYITHPQALEAIHWPTSGPAEEQTP